MKRFLQLALVLLLTRACVLAAGRPAPRKQPPNVILITLDTVRADHLGCYGYTEIQTPTLDGLAHDGVVFERAISQVPLTWPSHAAILTGTYPFQNGVQDFTGQPLSPEFRSVAQALEQHGYATGAVVSAFVLDRSWGLNRGFQFYDDAFSAETFEKKDIGLVDRKAGESVTHAINWLKKTPHRPFFLWLHLYDPHSPYDPPEPFHTQYKDHLYDGEIAYADHELGRLVEFLKQNHLYDRTLIAFLSDHGESLGDHGEHEHGFFVYNSTVHIPLIVKPPAGSGIQPGKVARPVETVAVAPAILQFAGVKDPIEKQFHSHGLFGPLAEKEDTGYSETFYPFSSFGWSPLHALETSRYHYIEAPEPELYDLTADPEEKNNLASQQTATLAVLKDKVAALLRERPFTPTSGANPTLSPDASEKLRALGYVSYRSAVTADALAKGLPDPKDKLWEFNSILEAGDAFQVNDFPTGQDLLEKVREKDPQMYIVPFMLGEVALRRQQWALASSELKKCLDRNPNFDQAMVGLGRALINQGQADEAKSWVNKALKYNPQNYRAWYELAYIESKGDKAAALAAYEKTVAIQPNFALARRDFGMFQYQQKNYADAVKQLSKAAELGMDKDPQLYNFLGISYSLTKRLPQAVESYHRALKIDPNLAEAHLNLGLAYEQLGRKSLASAEYQQACKLKQDFCRLVQNREKN
jgi:arylsulfatase A-like enzyme/Tfp pilus assembly protein PilF